MVRAVVVVDDDADVQDLVEAALSLDSRFAVVGVSDDAERAFDMAIEHDAALIVLDHDLAGQLTGLQAARAFKNAVPRTKVILFTCHAEIREAAAADPAIDAFVLKTDASTLLRVAQELWALSGSAV